MFCCYVLTAEHSTWIVLGPLIKEEKDEIFEDFQENGENIEIFEFENDLELIDYIFGEQKARYDVRFEHDEYVQNVIEDDVDTSDPMYKQIVEFVVTKGQASASILQRRFHIGYNRAATYIDLLEERGIIGPQNGSKPREVLVKLEENKDE